MSLRLPQRDVRRLVSDQDRYDAVAQAAAGRVISGYSTSFGLACRLLDRDVRDHVRNVYALVRLADDNVKVAVFPECALTSYTQDAVQSANQEEVAAAEAQIREICRRKGIAAILGSVYKVNGKVYNSAVVIDSKGELIERYGKVYLAGEKWFTPGNHISFFDLEGIPSTVMRLLAAGDGGDYGIHSEMFTTGLMHLHRAGKVSNRHKGQFDGVSVTTFAAGTAELYAWLDDNHDVAFLPVDVVNAPDVIARNRSMTSDTLRVLIADSM